MTFADSADYDKVQPDDKLSLLGLNDLAPGKVNKYSGLCSLLKGAASRAGLQHLCPLYTDNTLGGEMDAPFYR